MSGQWQPVGIIVAGELIVQRGNSKLVGLDVAIFDRVMEELIFHMHNLKMDETELAYLKAMAIFDVGRFELRSKRLKEVEKVEEGAMHFWRMLEFYTRSKKPEEETRFASLVLKLHSLRSISSAMRELDDANTSYNHLFCDNLPAMSSKQQPATDDLHAAKSSSVSLKEERVRIKSEPRTHLD